LGAEEIKKKIKKINDSSKSEWPAQHMIFTLLLAILSGYIACFCLYIVFYHLIVYFMI